MEQKEIKQYNQRAAACNKQEPDDDIKHHVTITYGITCEKTTKRQRKINNQLYLCIVKGKKKG